MLHVFRANGMPFELLVAWIFFASILRGSNCLNGEENQGYWKTLGNDDIQRALNQVSQDGVAKNVILFVADGMGLTTSTAARIYGRTEKGHLAFDKFPHIGVLKTYSANKLVPDSCSTATALFCGVKANHKTSGVDASVDHGDCTASLKDSAKLESIIKWAQDAGKATGFVTTTRVTHATPSALYAHTPDRNWECEASIPDNSRQCKDIAKQLIEDEPGRSIRVIMGGGRQCLQSDVINLESDPIDTWSCYSTDGRDLIADWTNDKTSLGVSHAVISNNAELNNLNVNAEYVLGVFANGHLKMDYERDRGPTGMPSLTNMTEKAIQVLQKNPRGFILMVEGGMIDFAHHRGHARQALDEAVEFSNAIERTLEMIDEDETLVIVTSDHSHSLVFSGYPDRGSSIIGIAQKSQMDDYNYTSLLYGTGGPNNYQYEVVNDEVVRPDPTNEDVEDYGYSQQAAVLTDEVTHGGADVLVYAKGPKSFLFHSVHEQTYVAYVIAYASQIGPYKSGTVGRMTYFSFFLLILTAFSLLCYF